MMRTILDHINMEEKLRGKEVIHSGHFMMSDYDAVEAEEEREEIDELVEILDDKSDDEETFTEKNNPVKNQGGKVTISCKNVINIRINDKVESIAIDGSLTKLFNAMEIAYK